tara:strand:+ start:108 stop:503 length:396 start_codon:yes stop_codon:yes gene_type:complete
MSLRITRAANTRIYLGEHLNQQNMEGTATDTVWIRRVDNLDQQTAVINVSNREGVSEAVLEVEQGYEIREGVSVKLKGISETWTSPDPFCEACGRGNRSKKKQLVCQAKVEVVAPEHINILRDDVVSGKKR